MSYGQKAEMVQPAKWGDPISNERKAKLQTFLDAWNQPDARHGERRSAFDGVKLTGADVFWLAPPSPHVCHELPYTIPKGDTYTNATRPFKFRIVTPYSTVVDIAAETARKFIDPQFPSLDTLNDARVRATIVIVGDAHNYEWVMPPEELAQLK